MNVKHSTVLQPDDELQPFRFNSNKFWKKNLSQITCGLRNIRYLLPVSRKNKKLFVTLKNVNLSNSRIFSPNIKLSFQKLREKSGNRPTFGLPMFRTRLLSKISYKIVIPL